MTTRGSVRARVSLLIEQWATRVADRAGGRVWKRLDLGVTPRSQYLDSVRGRPVHFHDTDRMRALIRALGAIESLGEIGLHSPDHHLPHLGAGVDQVDALVRGAPVHRVDISVPGSWTLTLWDGTPGRATDDMKGGYGRLRVFPMGGEFTHRDVLSDRILELVEAHSEPLSIWRRGRRRVLVTPRDAVTAHDHEDRGRSNRRAGVVGGLAGAAATLLLTNVGDVARWFGA